MGGRVNLAHLSDDDRQFVTGSIIKPRILISTSMASSRYCFLPRGHRRIPNVVPSRRATPISKFAGPLHLDGLYTVQHSGCTEKNSHNAGAGRMAAPLVLFPRLPSLALRIFAQQFLFLRFEFFRCTPIRTREATAFFFFGNASGSSIAGVSGAEKFERKNAVVF